MHSNTQGTLSEVSSVSWSSDGSRICSGSDDRTVRVWEVSSGDCIRTLKGHSSWVNAVAWSSDGSRICSGSDDKTVRVWEVSSGQCVHTTVFAFRFASLEFSLRSFPILSFCPYMTLLEERFVASWLELAAVWSRRVPRHLALLSLSMGM